MRDTDLMQLALGLVPPWQVKACTFVRKVLEAASEVEGCSRAGQATHSQQRGGKKWDMARGDRE
jgi:hypothetical protein